jgi:hypothetical protein
MSLRKLSRHWLLLIILLVPAGLSTAQESLTGAEFSRLVRAFSEEGGYFFSDNFTSNEDSYLTVVDKMKDLGATGGAYIGVGPEQNFTYIAKVRPHIAFIVDIRRQAMIQHLMYKAIFQLSPTPADFLSRLLSRPMSGKAPDTKASIDEVITYLTGVPANAKAYAENIAIIRKTIEQDFRFPLSVQDRDSLDYVYGNFREQGFDIGFDIDNRMSRRFGHLPVLREIILQKDRKGKTGNFLANAEDYAFVRDLHCKNRIIPVVGDFGGKKALASIGDYLRKKGYVVSVFYVSNVEIVLLEWGRTSGSFPAFVENIRKLPTNEHSLLLRSTFSYYGHPQQQPGYSLCTMLQYVSVFLRDFAEGRYRDYTTMIRTHYID